MPQLNLDVDPLESLRGFLSFLDEQGEVLHITRKVRQSFELAAIVQNIQKTVNKAILFENVEGYRGRVASNLFGSHRNIARMLSSAHESLSNTWVERCKGFRVFDYSRPSEHPVGLREIALSELPSITFHEKDGGPYVTGGIVAAKHPETGTTNLSYHRVLMTGSDELVIRLVPSGHLFLNQKICEDRGKPLECAILIGNSPLLMLAGTATLSRSESELDLASHFLGKAWPLRRCKTVNLEVPVDTEIVLEGEILPDTKRMEGSFGEWMGYYTLPEPNHIFKVKGAFAKENPIYYAVVTSSPEDIALLGIPTAGSILKAIQTWVPGVQDVVCWPTLQFCVIKMRKQYDGEEHKALMAALGADLSRILYAIVVDEDVDIYSPTDVLWAVSTRCRPDKDIFIIPDVPSYPRDPAKRHWGRVGIDATVPMDLKKEFERKRIPTAEKIR